MWNEQRGLCNYYIIVFFFLNFNTLNICFTVELKVQEQVKNLGFGTMPRSLCIVLENDLVDSCKVFQENEAFFFFWGEIFFFLN